MIALMLSFSPAAVCIDISMLRCYSNSNKMTRFVRV